MKYLYEYTAESGLVRADVATKTWDDVERVIAARKSDDTVDKFIGMAQLVDGHEDIEAEWYDIQVAIDALNAIPVTVTHTTEVVTFDEDTMEESTETVTITDYEGRDLTEDEQSELDTLVADRRWIEDGERDVEYMTEATQDADTGEIFEGVMETKVETWDATPWLKSYRGVKGADTRPVSSANVVQWKLDNYDVLRKAAYGTWQEQLEMQTDGTWKAHTKSVKTKYPKVQTSKTKGSN